MDTRSIDKFYAYLYDPAVAGFNTNFFWTVSGVPSGTASVVRLTSAEMSTKAQYLRGNFVMGIVAPVAPVAGQSKRWGLYSGAIPNVNAAHFIMVADKFYTRTYDSAGTKEETEITWLAAWTAALTKFEIEWVNINEINFYIGGIKVANHYQYLPEPTVMPLDFMNGNADNLDVDHIIFKGISCQVGPESAT